MVLKRVCAWCQADLGELECSESGVTHGICPSCQTQVEIEFILARYHLKPDLCLARFGEKGFIMQYRRSHFFLFSPGTDIAFEILKHLCQEMKVKGEEHDREPQDQRRKVRLST